MAASYLGGTKRPCCTALRLLLLFCLASLGACASFKGQPEPVVGSRVANVQGLGAFNAGVMGAYNSTDAQDRCVYVGPGKETCGLSQTAYRDYVIGTYLATANDRYSDFSRSLRVEAQGSSFALNVGALGAATAATLASENTANVLAAVAAFLTGTNATLDREVYFDRTVPALLASMEASRTRLRAEILAGLERPASEYSLAAAISDVQAYEAAASLDNAIRAITQDAAQRVQEANAYAEGVRTYTGPAEEGVRDIRSQIRTRLFALARADDRDTLVSIAGNLGLTVPEAATTEDVRRLIQLRVADAQTVAETNELAQKIGVTMGGADD